MENRPSAHYSITSFPCNRETLSRQFAMFCMASPVIFRFSLRSHRDWCESSLYSSIPRTYSTSQVTWNTGGPKSCPQRCVLRNASPTQPCMTDWQWCMSFVPMQPSISAWPGELQSLKNFCEVFPKNHSELHCQSRASLLIHLQNSTKLMNYSYILRYCLLEWLGGITGALFRSQQIINFPIDSILAFNSKPAIPPSVTSFWRNIWPWMLFWE